MMPTCASTAMRQSAARVRGLGANIPMNQEDLFRLLDIPARDASDCVLPISEIVESSARLVHTGSCVHVLLGADHYIISARHVIAENDQVPVVHGPKRYFKLDKPIPRLKTVGTIHCEADLAYSPLSPAQVSALGEWKAFDLAAVKPDLRGVENDAYLLIGHPVSRSEHRKGVRELQAECHVVVLFPAGAKLYETVGAHPDVHLLLRYTRENVMQTGGAVGAGPHPRGMSGGAVLRPRPRTSGNEAVILDLVAIGIEYHPQHHLVIGTRIGVLTSWMSERDPALAAKLPPSKRLKLKNPPDERQTIRCR